MFYQITNVKKKRNNNVRVASMSALIKEIKKQGWQIGDCKITELASELVSTKYNSPDGKNTIYKQEVKYIKKHFLTEKQRKSRSIKQAEQVGNTFIDFIGLDGKTYKLIYRTPTKTYTNYVDFKEIYNTGIMHKGNNVRVQDKYNKVNHAENNLIKKIDKNL